MVFVISSRGVRKELFSNRGVESDLGMSVYFRNSNESRVRSSGRLTSSHSSLVSSFAGGSKAAPFVPTFRDTKAVAFPVVIDRVAF